MSLRLNLFLQGDGSAGNQSNNSQGSSYANNIVSAGAGVSGGGAGGAGGGAGRSSAGSSQNFSGNDDIAHRRNSEAHNTIGGGRYYGENLTVSALGIYTISGIGIAALLVNYFSSSIQEVLIGCNRSHGSGGGSNISSKSRIYFLTLNEGVGHVVNLNIQTVNFLAILIEQASDGSNLARIERNSTILLQDYINIVVTISERLIASGRGGGEYLNEVIAGRLKGNGRNLNVSYLGVSNTIEVLLQVNEIPIGSSGIVITGLYPTLGSNQFTALGKGNGNNVICRNKFAILQIEVDSIGSFVETNLQRSTRFSNSIGASG